MRFFILCGFLLLPLPSFAALSFFYDSEAQIQALLAAPELGDLVQQMPITAIAYQGETPEGGTLWQVETESCRVVAELIGRPPVALGPLHWSVKTLGACEAK